MFSFQYDVSAVIFRTIRDLDEKNHIANLWWNLNKMHLVFYLQSSHFLFRRLFIRLVAPQPLAAHGGSPCGRLDPKMGLVVWMAVGWSSDACLEVQDT